MPSFAEERAAPRSRFAASGSPRICGLQQDVVERACGSRAAGDPGRRCRRRSAAADSGLPPTRISPLARRNESRRDQHQRALAAARRTDEAHELAAADLERHVVERGEASRPSPANRLLTRAADDRTRRPPSLRRPRRRSPPALARRQGTSARWPAGNRWCSSRRSACPSAAADTSSAGRTSSASSCPGTRPSDVAPGAQTSIEVDLELLQDLFLGRGRELLDDRGGGGVGILARLVPALEARRDELPVEIGIGLRAGRRGR